MKTQHATKSALTIGFLGLLCLLLPGSLRAGEILTYTGSPYSTCGGGYTSACTTYSLDITIDTTLSLAQLENLTLGSTGDIPSADITSYSFTDGFGVDITPANGYDLTVELTTNGSGTPTAWVVAAGGFTNQASPTFFGCTESTPGALPACGGFNDVSSDYVSGEGYGEFGYATNYGGDGTLGTWQISGSNAAVPEPSSLLLLGIGLLGLVAMARSKRQAPPTSF
ncbi:MAG: PEP-CTERM sorting domain-containing protein [Bryobacteraceae bacterium]